MVHLAHGGSVFDLSSLASGPLDRWTVGQAESRSCLTTP